jgi:hypothetical protein
MTVYIKSGGAWRAATNGRLWIKSGGAWRVANYCHIKSGGAWRDSGYRGFPNPPTAPTVASWSFTAVNVSFSGPSGGAPVDHYEIVMTNSNLNPDVNYPASSANILQGFSNNTSGSASFGVAEDWQVAFFVRSVTAAGLKSAWVAGHRAQIGHTEQGYYANEGRTRGWQNAVNCTGGPNQPPRHRDEIVQIYVPNTVTMTQWNIYCVVTFSSYVSAAPPNNHQVYQWVNGAQGGLFEGAPWNTSSLDYALGIASVNGQNNYWGLMPRGLGWSPAGVSDAQLLYAALTISGTEAYTVSVYYVTRAYLANAYW